MTTRWRRKKDENARSSNKTRGSPVFAENNVHQPLNQTRAGDVRQSSTKVPSVIIILVFWEYNHNSLNQEPPGLPQVDDIQYGYHLQLSPSPLTKMLPLNSMMAA